MPSTAKSLGFSLSLLAISWLVISRVYGIDEGVIVDEVAAGATTIANSKCQTRACKGAHAEGGKHCEWNQKDGLKGNCFICDGDDQAWLCGWTLNEKCEVNPKASWSKVYCGVKAEGACKKDDKSPTGASCLLVKKTEISCILTSCKQPGSQDPEDPIAQ